MELGRKAIWMVAGQLSTVTTAALLSALAVSATTVLACAPEASLEPMALPQLPSLGPSASDPVPNPDIAPIALGLAGRRIADGWGDS